MAEAVNRKVSVDSARAHTRRANQNSSIKFPSGLFSKVLLVLFVGVSAWAYQAIQPPPTKICGSPGAPPITGPRIKLRDGRHLAYKEYGVSKDVAKYKIMFLHPFGSCRHDPLIRKLSTEFVEELGLYILNFDRPGYGESDPHPSRTLKSLAMDIEELADQLGLDSKFYIIGYSMGGTWTWSCLKYIPHRLAGVTLLTPFANYWWPGFPANLSTEVYREMFPRDQWAYRVAHYTPWLSYWWHTQKWFPGSSVIGYVHDILTKQDLEIAATFDMQTTLKPMATNDTLSLRSFLEWDKLSGPNFWDWSMNLRKVLRQESKEYVLKKPVPAVPMGSNPPAAQLEEYLAHVKDNRDVTCLMLASMVPELQKQFLDHQAFAIMTTLNEMFYEQAYQERYLIHKAFRSCKMGAGTSVSAHVLKMKGYLDNLARLGTPISRGLAVSTILDSLPDSYDQFILNFYKQGMDRTVSELHWMLELAELSIKKTPPVLEVNKGKPPFVKGKAKAKAKAKEAKAKKAKAQPKARSKDVCFGCKQAGHWKRSCPKLLGEKRKTQGVSSSGT